MRSLITAAVVAVVLLRGAPIEACSCIESGPPCQTYFQVDAVFVGAVRTITELDAPPDPMPFRQRLVTFTVERALRGLEGASVAVTTGLGGGDCGYPFKPGERYLVYAYKAKDGQLRTGICSRTRPISEAAEDLQFIDTLRTAKPGGRVSGVVKHWERDLAGNEPRQYPPLSFVPVQVNGSGGGGQAETDEQGRYEITGLRPGKYEVQVFPAANFSTTLLQRDVELRDARACAVVDFGVHFDGRISGSVRTADGRPAGDVRVQLVAAAKAAARGITETLTAKSDSDGHYELRDVPPGQYVVGVGLKRSMESLDDLYPATFYPQATTAAAAEVITVGEGNRQELQPFTLPPPRRQRELTGVVVWPDGRPAADVSVSLADADESWRQLAAAIRTDGDGGFRFTVSEGASYRVRAYADIPGEPKPRQAMVVSEPFVVTDGMPPVRVVLKPANR